MGLPQRGGGQSRVVGKDQQIPERYSALTRSRRYQHEELDSQKIRADNVSRRAAETSTQFQLPTVACFPADCYVALIKLASISVNFNSVRPPASV